MNSKELEQVENWLIAIDSSWTAEGNRGLRLWSVCPLLKFHSLCFSTYFRPDNPGPKYTNLPSSRLNTETRVSPLLLRKYVCEREGASATLWDVRGIQMEVGKRFKRGRLLSVSFNEHRPETFVSQHSKPRTRDAGPTVRLVGKTPGKKNSRNRRSFSLRGTSHPFSRS